MGNRDSGPYTRFVGIYVSFMDMNVLLTSGPAAACYRGFCEEPHNTNNSWLLQKTCIDKKGASSVELDGEGGKSAKGDFFSMLLEVGPLDYGLWDSERSAPNEFWCIL